MCAVCNLQTACASPLVRLGHLTSCVRSCHVCSLTLVSSPHLARSYHHLFPVPAFEPLPDDDRGPRNQVCPAVHYRFC